MSPQSSHRTSNILGAALLLLVVSQPAAAQCSVASNTGENLYVTDPVLGCKKFPLSGGLLTAKPRNRRGVTTHFLLVRHYADQYKTWVQTNRGSMSNQTTGIDGDEFP